MKKLCDWIKDIFATIKLNWRLFLFFHSKKKQKKFKEEMKEITENCKRKGRNEILSLSKTARINELKKTEGSPTINDNEVSKGFILGKLKKMR